MELQPYSSFRPTAFDPSGLSLPERQNWLVCPVSRTRDSDYRTESNWNVQLETLGGESETVEVHRFGHWGPGWFEIVLIDPADTGHVRIAEELADTLEDYSVLDEMDLSSREEAAYSACWESWAAREFIDYVAKGFDLKRDTLYLLKDIDADKIRELYESGIPSGDYHEDGAPTGSRMRASFESLDISRFVRWIRENRPRRKTIVRVKCDCCEMLSLNGHSCHETGCPNSRKRWDPVSETWVRFLECHRCGYEVREGESCDCQAGEDAYEEEANV